MLSPETIANTVSEFCETRNTFLFLYLSTFARPVFEAFALVLSRFTFYVLRER